MIFSVVILIAAFALREWANFLLILLATGLVLVTEIVNSAIEAMCDFLEEQHNEKIKVIKDVAAAAVGLSILVWIIVCSVELHDIWSKFNSAGG